MLITKNPTAFTTPDVDQGGTAVTGAGNTGHGDTTTNTVGAGTVKSCKWTGFTAPGGAPLSKKLIFGWSQDGVFGGTGTNDFRVQYSIDGGSIWNDVFLHSAINGLASNANETVNLSATQDITLVQLRDRIRSITDPANTVTASVSNIRIEVVVQDPQVIVMM